MADLPVYERIHQALLSCGVLHMDETTIQCNKEAGRKAWLFADTPKGTKANAVFYTIVESARANDLDVYEYLNYLLTELTELRYAHKEAPEVIDKYLPWSDQLPEEVRLKQKRKKCVEK